MDSFVALVQNVKSLEERADNALHKAESAMALVKSHEEICAERYASINRQLVAIPDIYKLLGGIQRVVYIGVGIWVGIPALIGFFLALLQLANFIKGFAH